MFSFDKILKKLYPKSTQASPHKKLEAEDHVLISSCKAIEDNASKIDFKIVNEGKTIVIEWNDSIPCSTNQDCVPANKPILEESSSASTISSVSPLPFSLDEINAALDAPPMSASEQEEKDAVIVFKLICPKCKIHGKIDTYTATYPCPICGATMNLFTAYVNYEQHIEAEIKEKLSDLYSSYLRGNMNARETWHLLSLERQHDSRLNSYMQSCQNSMDFIPNQAKKIHIRTLQNVNQQQANYTKPDTVSRKTSVYASINPRESFIGKDKVKNFKQSILIPELQNLYEKVNSMHAIKTYSPNNTQSLLNLLGYKVGKSSSLDIYDRKKIIAQAFVADTVEINKRYESAMTRNRLQALIHFLRSINNSDSCKYSDFSVAIQQRKEDISWMLNYSDFITELKKIHK